MILISNDFWHNIKMYNFDPYNVLLSFATNIAVLLMTASVLTNINTFSKIMLLCYHVFIVLVNCFFSYFENYLFL